MKGKKLTSGYRRGLMLAAMSSIAMASAFSTSAKDTLAALKDGERLEATYTATGCFTHSRHLFVFEDKSVKVFEITRQSDGSDTKIPLGTVPLSPAEIGQLDQTFDSYRRKPDIISTSRESLSVDLWKGDQKISSEVVADARSAVIGATPSRLQLWQLIERAKGK